MKQSRQLTAGTILRPGLLSSFSGVVGLKRVHVGAIGLKREHMRVVQGARSTCRRDIE